MVETVGKKERDREDKNVIHTEREGRREGCRSDLICVSTMEHCLLHLYCFNLLLFLQSYSTTGIEL